MIEHNAGRIAADLSRAGLAALPRAHAVTIMYGAILKTRVQARASGRPGPRAITGDYRRSWTVRTTLRATGTESVVGTNKPQGRRLEYGFAGQDSLGRSYSQPPFPHAGPALDETGPEYVQALAAIAGWVS